MPRRRLCREIVGRLKVDEKQDLILVDDENMNDKEESNNDVDSDESDTIMMLVRLQKKLLKLYST